VRSGPILIKIRCNVTCFRPVQGFDLLGWGSSPHSASCCASPSINPLLTLSLLVLALVLNTSTSTSIGIDTSSSISTRTSTITITITNASADLSRKNKWYNRMRFSRCLFSRCLTFVFPMCALLGRFCYH
jgi:hypothetical protein